MQDEKRYTTFGWLVIIFSAVVGAAIGVLLVVWVRSPVEPSSPGKGIHEWIHRNSSGMFGPSSVNPDGEYWSYRLRYATEPERRQEALSLLSALQDVDATAREALIEALSDADPQIRKKAVDFLHKDEANEPAIKARLKDADPKVRNAAQNWLDDWRSEQP